MKRGVVIFLICSLVFILGSFAVHASSDLPRLKVKTSQVVPSTTKKLNRVCDLSKNQLRVECGNLPNNVPCKTNPIIFDAKDLVSDKYRNMPQRVRFVNSKEPLGYVRLDINHYEASLDGKKMSLGLAYEICESKGMTIPSQSELYYAYLAQKNAAKDACFFDPEEYWMDVFTVDVDQNSVSGYSYSMKTGDYEGSGVKALKSVRCVAKG